MTALLPRPKLQDHPFTADPPPGFIDTLAQFDSEVEFAPGQLIFREGTYADKFYLLLSGEVAIEATPRCGDAAVAIQKIGGGDILGWSWLYPPFFWNFSARAVTHCHAIAFNAPAVMIHCEENPIFGYQLMKRLTQHVIRRLQCTRELLLRAQNEHAHAHEEEGAGCGCGGRGRRCESPGRSRAAGGDTAATVLPDISI